MTPTSSKSRDEEAHEALFSLLKHAEKSVCVGDFFDTFTNSEEAIFQALPVAKATTHILSGNHDVRNVQESVSSLRLIDELYGNCIFKPQTWAYDNTEFHFVPHVLSQEQFEEQLVQTELTARRTGEAIKILFLHCNYANDLAAEDQVSLNLTRERAEELLATFNHIIIGHEHVPREDFDGRVLVVGSFRPTGFDNVCDKRVLTIDTETGDIDSQVVWSAEEKAFTGPASEAPGGRAYYDLIDDLPTGESQRLVVKLFDQGAYGVRLRVAETANEMQEIELAGIDKLPATIAADLEEHRPDLVPLYKELLENC